MQVEGIPTALACHAYSRCNAVTPTANHQTHNELHRVVGNQYSACHSICLYSI